MPDELISRRFQELLDMGKRVVNTRFERVQRRQRIIFVHNADSEEWATSAASFLERVMTRDSLHFRNFTEYAKNLPRCYFAEKCQAVLKAAKADFDGGY